MEQKGEQLINPEEEEEEVVDGNIPKSVRDLHNWEMMTLDLHF